MLLVAVSAFVSCLRPVSAAHRRLPKAIKALLPRMLPHTETADIVMPGDDDIVAPDQYCSRQVPLPDRFMRDEYYILGLAPIVQQHSQGNAGELQDNAHHIMLFGCMNRMSADSSGSSCGSEGMGGSGSCTERGYCTSGPTRGKLFVPNGTGISIGRNAFQSFEILVHYKVAIPNIKDRSGFRISVRRKPHDLKEVHVKVHIPGLVAPIPPNTPTITLPKATCGGRA